MKIKFWIDDERVPGFHMEVGDRKYTWVPAERVLKSPDLGHMDPDLEERIREILEWSEAT